MTLLKKLWPFVLCRTMEEREKKQAGDFLEKLNKEIEDREDAEKACLQMQRYFSSLIGGSKDERVRDLLNDLVVYCQNNHVKYCRGEYKFDSSQIGSFVEEDVTMHRLVVLIGMTKHSIPEFVARDFGRSVENAILEKWRSQSLLLVNKDIK